MAGYANDNEKRKVLREYNCSFEIPYVIKA